MRACALQAVGVSADNVADILDWNRTVPQVVCEPRIPLLFEGHSFVLLHFFFTFGRGFCSPKNKYKSTYIFLRGLSLFLSFGYLFQNIAEHKKCFRVG
jgi:hypothetical protein